MRWYIRLVIVASCSAFLRGQSCLVVGAHLAEEHLEAFGAENLAQAVVNAVSLVVGQVQEELMRRLRDKPAGQYDESVGSVPGIW